jgi:hypothetical protein
MTFNKSSDGIFTQAIDQKYEKDEDSRDSSLEFYHLEKEEDFINSTCYFESEEKEFSINTNYVKQVQRQKEKPKLKKQFKFKFILQPKWQETISKLKTLWFITIKNKIVGYFKYFINAGVGFKITERLESYETNSKITHSLESLKEKENEGDSKVIAEEFVNY